MVIMYEFPGIYRSYKDENALVFLFTDTENVGDSFDNSKPLLGEVVFRINQLKDADQHNYFLTLIDGFTNLLTKLQDFY